MSILIKGMEMPTSCTECPCCRHDNWNGETAHQCNVSFITFGAEDENWIYNTRPNWCPLIELPPHGRLIDAEKLKSRIVLDEDASELKKISADIRKWIDIQETVIEAEGETDGR